MGKQFDIIRIEKNFTITAVWCPSTNDIEWFKYNFEFDNSNKIFFGLMELERHLYIII